ncbi:MAG: ArnT family glycosyltransferase [Parcubacteria group bacterium]
MQKIIRKLKESSIRKYYKIFFWFIIVLLTILFQGQHILNPDEGVLLNGAWQMLNGSVLYLDIFSYVAPFGFYLIYWLFYLFGATYMVANLFSIVLLILSAWVLFKSSQLIKKTSLNYLVPLFYIIASSWFPLINHNFYSTFFVIISTYFFLKYINNRQSFYIVLTAIFTGITIITLQQKGLALLAATSLSLLLFIDSKLKQKIKDLSLYIFVLFLPLLFLTLWPLKTIFNNLIYFPLFNYTEANTILLNSWIAVMIVLIVLSFKYFKSKRKKVYYLLLLQFFLFLSTLTLPDVYHILLASSPLFILIPDLISLKNSKDLKEKTYFIIVTSFIVTIILIPIFNYDLVFKKDREFKDNIKASVESNCEGDYIYVGPFVPNLYFELKKINPSPYDILLSNHHTEKQFQEAKEKIIEHQVDCAILSYPKSLKRFNYNRNNAVDTHIRENYYLLSNEIGVNLYKKIND